MKNQSIQFEIIDHRKSKSQPQWVTMYLAQIRIYLKPINFNVKYIITSKTIMLNKTFSTAINCRTLFCKNSFIYLAPIIDALFLYINAEINL